MKKLLVITVLFLFPLCKIAAFNIDTTAILAGMKSKEFGTRIMGLIDYSQYLFQAKSLFVQADSAANIALVEVQLANSDDYFYYCALNYREVCLASNFTKAESFLNKAYELAAKNKSEQQQFIILINQTLLYIEYAMYPKAQESIQKSLKYILDSKYNSILYFLTLGDLQLRTNEKIEAFENYNTAIRYSIEKGYDSLLFVSYDRMSSFYQSNSDWSKAKEILLTSTKYVENKKIFNIYDSLLLKAKLLYLYAKNDEVDLALKLMDELLPLAKKHKFNHIENFIFGALRSHYLSNDKQKEICNLYCVKYPEELVALKNFDNKIYYRVQALIFENNKQLDSAVYYLQLAEEETLLSNNAASIANFYNRKGQFFLRQQDFPLALNAFQNYFENAKKSLHFPFIIDAAKILDSLYFVSGDITKAYTFSKIKERYTDSNATQTQKDKLLVIEIENISKLKELEFQKEELQHNRKANFQVLLIIAIIIFFIIALVVISRFQISKAVLKLFSYITFVLFFEFIIYLLDNIIHKWAHGQPLKIVAVKVILISILLPIHHATDYRVLQYLTKKNLVRDKSQTLKQTLAKFWTKFRNWLNIHEEHDEKVEAKPKEKA